VVKRRTLVLICMFGIALVAPASAEAAVTATASDGTLNQDGSATVPVTVACAPGSRVLEAHLTLSQQGGAIWGMAGLASVRCNGRPNTYFVTVRPNGGAFTAGTAYASPYILVQHRGTGATESGGASSEITLS
jgi:hypothetical protein